MVSLSHDTREGRRAVERKWYAVRFIATGERGIVQMDAETLAKAERMERAEISPISDSLGRDMDEIWEAVVAIHREKMRADGERIAEAMIGDAEGRQAAREGYGREDAERVSRKLAEEEEG